MAFAVKLGAGVAALAVLGAASSAWAIKPLGPTIIDWTLSGGTFDDGGTFSGTFTYNTVTDSITRWDVTTSDGPAVTDPEYTNGGPPPIFFPVFDMATDDGGNARFEQFDGFPPIFILFDSVFEPTGIALGLTGTVTGLGGSETQSGFLSAPVTRDVTGGTAVGVAGVPEPAGWTLMILGFGGAGAMLRRRRLAAVPA